MLRLRPKSFPVWCDYWEPELEEEFATSECGYWNEFCLASYGKYVKSFDDLGRIDGKLFR